MPEYVRHPDEIYTMDQPAAEFDGRDGLWTQFPLSRNSGTRYLRADVVEPKIQSLEEKNASLEAHIERFKEAFLDADTWEDVRDLFKTLPETSLERRDLLKASEAFDEYADQEETNLMPSDEEGEAAVKAMRRHARKLRTKAVTL